MRCLPSSVNIGKAEVLIRAKHDRKLFAVMRSGKAPGNVEIEIQRVTARKQARKGRSYRMINAEVHYGRFLLPDPKNEEEPVVMYGVHVLEVEPPGDALPVEWMLLTSM